MLVLSEVAGMERGKGNTRAKIFKWKRWKRKKHTVILDGMNSPGSLEDGISSSKCFKDEI